MKVQLVGIITLPVVVGVYPQQIAKEVLEDIPLKEGNPEKYGREAKQDLV